ncbi:MAG: hypothetical protein WCK47_13730 [bacterium]
MATKIKKAPFKKRLMAKYVVWLEAAGFVFIGTLVAAMVGSAIYEIDDVMKYSDAAAAPRTEPVSIPGEAYVDSVGVKAGENVKQGQALLLVTNDTEDLALLRSLASVQTALDLLRQTTGATIAPAGMEQSLADALARGKAAPRKEQPHAIAAPVGGMLSGERKEPWKDMAGKIVSGVVGAVYNYDTLRFLVPVGGDNAMRVRINLLAEQDILNWKGLTRAIKANNPSDDPAIRHIWEMLQGKLEEIKPDTTPLKRSMPEIIGVLNELLRRRDFYDAQAWAGKPLASEAGQLLNQGVNNLDTDALIRLNRLLLQAAMPTVIADSGNKHPAVKARLYIPVQTRTPEGKTIKGKPLVFSAAGRVVREPEGGKVLIELENPPAQVVDYMKRQRETAELRPVTSNGAIVVGRVSLFRFLFK